MCIHLNIKPFNGESRKIVYIFEIFCTYLKTNTTAARALCPSCSSRILPNDCEYLLKAFGSRKNWRTEKYKYETYKSIHLLQRRPYENPAHVILACLVSIRKNSESGFKQDIFQVYFDECEIEQIRALRLTQLSIRANSPGSMTELFFRSGSRVLHWKIKNK